MDITTQVMTVLGELAITVSILVFWIRGLMAKLDGLASANSSLEAKLDKMMESSGREHSDIKEGLGEVAGQHGHHDVKHASLETKVDELIADKRGAKK